MRIIRKILMVLVTIILPFFFIMTAVRLLLNPVFLIVEYNLPGFPQDPYGFTKEDRLHYGNLSMQYLLNDADISYLGDLQLPDGTSLYNQRELSHMHDVKVLVQATIKVWIGFGIFLALMGLLSWGAKWLSEYWRAISSGGWLALGIIALVLVMVFLNFNALFTDFHRIFFTGDTWLFYYSDSLIRLFPLPFWQDAFIFMGGFTALGGLLAALLGRRWSLNR